MTAQELIDILKEYPANFPIYIGHYAVTDGVDYISCGPIKGITNDCFKGKTPLDAIALCDHAINGKGVNCYD